MLAGRTSQVSPKYQQAVAIEFVGPLAVAVLSSRRLLDFCWIILATAGLTLLLPVAHIGVGTDPLGALFALAAGGCWALYIVYGQKAGADHGAHAAAIGSVISAVIVVPIGLIERGPALFSSAIVDETACSAAEGFAKLAAIQEDFRRDYQDMLHAVVAVAKPTVLCTIYDAIPGLPRHAVAALSVFNDIILREGFRRGLPILDLRLLCDEARDYSDLSPIEPSEVGGAKIARGIRCIVTGHDFSRGESVVYGK